MTFALFLILLIICSSYVIFYDDTEIYMRTRIIRSDCVRYRINNALDRFQCALVVEYTLNNQTYQKSIKYTGHVQLKRNDYVTIVINKNNPHDIYVTRFDRNGTYICLVFMFISIYIIGMLWLSSVATKY